MLLSGAAVTLAAGGSEAAPADTGPVASGGSVSPRPSPLPGDLQLQAHVSAGVAGPGEGHF